MYFHTKSPHLIQFYTVLNAEGDCNLEQTNPKKNKNKKTFVPYHQDFYCFLAAINAKICLPHFFSTSAENCHFP